MDYEFLDTLSQSEENQVDTAELYVLTMDGNELEAYIEL